MNWNIHHITETASTNILARDEKGGDVFWADVQTAGRGRLDHKWISAPGEGLAFSAVIDASGMEIPEVVTFPLVAGLAVAKFLREKGIDAGIKWPNDILVRSRKICGILCELVDDRIVCGIGLNFNQRTFPPEISATATSVFLETGETLAAEPSGVLEALGGECEAWREGGFAALWPEISELDLLRGRNVSVLKTDSDPNPETGLCGGIQLDGTLLVGGVSVPAGEAHVL